MNFNEVLDGIIDSLHEAVNDINTGVSIGVPDKTISSNKTEMNGNYKTLMSRAYTDNATGSIVTSQKRIVYMSDNPVKAVYPNKKKKVFCVLWKDGTNTLLHLQNNDVWDEEKALALCFMKKLFGNKGKFNDILKEALPDYYKKN